MAQPANNMSARELVLARRRAMSTVGKAALTSNAAQAAPARTAAPAPAATVSSASYSTSASTPATSSRAASLARRQAMSTGGKRSIQSKDRTRTDEVKSATPATPTAPAAAAKPAEKKGCGCGCDGTRAECKASIKPVSKNISSAASVNQARAAINHSVARIASLARREATSSRGKAGVSKNGMTAAQTARAGNPNLSSRDLSKALREQRSKNGNLGQKKSEPCGRRRPKQGDTGAAEDQPWKVGASETVSGQTVTGTMVGRSDDVTGDEPSTCRSITGTEYLGADIFRDFCQADPSGTPRKVTVTSTSHGNAVSGNRMGRSGNVTGNEPGTCKNVTGNEYVTGEQVQAYCGELPTKSPRKISVVQTGKGKSVSGTNVGRSEKVTGNEPGMKRSLTGTQYTQAEEIGTAPAKVGVSGTLRGGNVTGTMVGRRENMTGDEPGSCRNITGDDYVGKEQYSNFCSAAPAPGDRKVGVSATGKGMSVTGTMTDREGKVTGNEPGVCKAVTGTPYAGADAVGNFCQAEDAAAVNMRNKAHRGTPGMNMTGIQPGAGGVMTGDKKGVCEPVTGTPYVGANQFADACPATAADTASSDYPQATAGNAPWQQFSVEPPSGGAYKADGSTGVTGNQYEQGRITGPFGMAPGKLTGTEEARFGKENVLNESMQPVVAEDFEGRTKSRVTGEGQDAGLKITGDDWERGEHVTGTEGKSAAVRNPTMRMGPASAMAVTQKRNEELPMPNSKVTGGSGNTEKGSLITYSGGARG